MACGKKCGMSKKTTKKGSKKKQVYENDLLVLILKQDVTMFIRFPRDLLELTGERAAPLEQDVSPFQQYGLANRTTFDQGKEGQSRL